MGRLIAWCDATWNSPTRSLEERRGWGVLTLAVLLLATVLASVMVVRLCHALPGLLEVRTLGESLSSDSQFVSWYLKDDARQRSARLVQFALFPDVPTMQEAGVAGFEVQNWQGLVGPAHLPPAIVKTLNETCNKALADPEIRKQMLEQGNEIGGGTPEQFAALIHAEAERWGKVVKAGHIRPE